MSTVTRILRAIANAMRGFFRMVMTAGKATFEWVKQDILVPAYETACEVAGIAGRTATDFAAALPSSLASLLPRRGGPAPGPEATPEAEPVDAQRERRRALLAQQDAEDRRRCDAISVRAGVRAVLRGQEPLGVPAHVAAWMRSLDEATLMELARTDLDAISRLVATLPRPVAPPVEQATPIADWRAHLAARAAANEQRRGRPASLAA